MGSLPASGIPVVTKQSLSFRKCDIRIKATDSRDDSISVITTNRPALSRPIGSGSIVRDSGVVDYFEEKVVGAIRMARTCDERIASDINCSRQVVVDLGDSKTIAVVETSLMPTTPQKWALNAGDRIVRQDSISDTTIDRVK
jgi:hypothetical protein